MINRNQGLMLTFETLGKSWRRKGWIAMKPALIIVDMLKDTFMRGDG